MTLLTSIQLDRLAVSHSDEVLGKLIRGRCTYDERRPSFEWNDDRCRHVHTESMVVWRDVGGVEMHIASDGTIVKFRDETRLAEPKFRRLAKKQLLAIAQTTGLVAADAIIEQIREGDLYGFHVRQYRAGLPGLIAFTVNPQRRQVAAFEVLYR